MTNEFNNNVILKGKVSKHKGLDILSNSIELAKAVLENIDLKNVYLYNNDMSTPFIGLQDISDIPANNSVPQPKYINPQIIPQIPVRNQERIDYINNNTNASVLGLQPISNQQDIVMGEGFGKKRVKSSAQEIADLFYPTMKTQNSFSEQSQIKNIKQPTFYEKMIGDNSKEEYLTGGAADTSWLSKFPINFEPQQEQKEEVLDLFSFLEDKELKQNTDVSNYTFDELRNMAQTQSDRNFFDALEILYSIEGGYNNIKQDHGGKTNMGVSQKAYTAYCKENNLPIKDVKFLSQFETYKFYYKEYWIKSSANKLNNIIDAFILFDTSVHHGVYGAKNIYKKSNGNLWKVLENRYELFNKIIENKNKSQNIFYRGWINRLKKLCNLLIRAESIGLIDKQEDSERIKNLIMKEDNPNK